MATLVNKHNRKVKVIIPNMREFRAFYSDNEGVIGMFFKRDWEKVEQESSWKPNKEQMEALGKTRRFILYNCDALESLYVDLKKL